MKSLHVALLLLPLTLAACRAGAREGLGPTGIPIGSTSLPSPGPTVWKAEYYKISDG